MANEQNLRPGEHIPTREEAKKGGIASGESRRRKKLLRECLDELLAKEYTSEGKTLTGSEALAVTLIKKALKGDVKAFEVLRDTAGEKPVEKVTERANNRKNNNHSACLTARLFYKNAISC